jgi:hypothetical protein
MTENWVSELPIPGLGCSIETQVSLSHWWKIRKSKKGVFQPGPVGGVKLDEKYCMIRLLPRSSSYSGKSHVSSW